MAKNGLNSLNKKDVLYVMNRDLKHRYGITVDDYADMFAKQSGCCAICGYCSFELGKILRVDHCHKTNKVRGLLCLWCNTAIAYLKEKPANFKKAIAYLKKHK